MQLADPTDVGAADQHLGGAPGVQRRVLGPFIARLERADERLQVGLAVVEVHRPRLLRPLRLDHRTVGRGADPDRLAQPAHRYGPILGARIPQEHAADLEHPDALDLARLVVAQVRHQRADQRAAHHRELAGDRIEQAHRVRFAGEVELPLRLAEAEIDHLVVIRAGDPLAQLVQRAAALRRRQRPRRDARRLGADALEAVQPGHFLDQVLLDREVVAVGRRLDHEGLAVALHRQRQAR